VHIGSDEHKELFCRSFVESFRAYDPAEWPWPQLDEISLARLRAIPIWTLALEVELGAGEMLGKYAKTEGDPLVREALELQAYEEARHGRILQCLIERYGLRITPDVPKQDPTRGAFIRFGYNECVDSFAGFGIFRLARDARILPESLTSLFTRLIYEEARHIVFFTNWIAWDRARRGLPWPLLQGLPILCSYGGAIARRIEGGGKVKLNAAQEPNLDLFADFMKSLTPAIFIRTCLEENDRYMASFDPRLLRPRFIPAMAKLALGIIEAIEKIRTAFPPMERGPASAAQDETGGAGSRSVR
jgi:hypothetical protein